MAAPELELVEEPAGAHPDELALQERPVQLEKVQEERAEVVLHVAVRGAVVVRAEGGDDHDEEGVGAHAAGVHLRGGGSGVARERGCAGPGVMRVGTRGGGRGAEG